MIQVRLPGLLLYREVAVRVVAAVCEAAAVVRGRVIECSFSEAMITAVGEAFNNVALHAYAGRAPGDVLLQFDIDVDRLVVSVIDDGKSFDIRRVPEPELDIRDPKEGGFGVFLMKRLTDEMTYSAGQPNVLRLTKYFLRPGTFLR